MACPPRDDFQIGWICALPVEAAAAAEMLDEDFGILGEQDVADSNTYILGRIGKHHVVIACLPGGQYGTTSATTVANNMLRTFSKSLRIGLMVGVGGGIPSTTHDIRLGDIVISYPEGTCGGVVQYDIGKVIAGGEFERTGSLNSPPRSLLTAVSMMRAAALRDDPRYLEYIRTAIGRTARTRKSFGRPTVQSDRLFQAQHDHPANTSSCDGCLAEWEEIRSEREDSDPQLHYGIIASGNKVIKHGWTREQLRLETGAVCFEMEAAGLLLDFPCIVIRGVCDYADSHKNKQWQGYAALAAASYTKELLGYIPTGHVLQENLVIDMCEGLKEEIKGTNQRVDRAYDQQEQHHNEQTMRALIDQQQRCHQAFKIANYEEQKDINPRRTEGTCQWALQSDQYVRWSERCCNDLLWVSADPGCGKSVLAKSIIDDYLQAPGTEVTMCYYFFKGNDEQDSLATGLCAILHQLFTQRPNLIHHALSSWKRNGERLQQEADELWRILITAASSADTSCKIICVFDALDECRDCDQGRLIQKLKHLHSQPSLSARDTGWLKFLVTSRPYNHIQRQFQAIADTFPHLHLKGEEENDQIHKEINLVVKIRVAELAKMLRLSFQIQQRLEEKLLQMQHRTYLWLHLAMDDIQNTFENSLRPAKESIRLVPASVNAAYEKILNRVPAEQKDKMIKILQIIVAARRPLTIREMAMALGIAIYPQSRTVVEAGLDPVDLDKKIRQLCGLFVFTNNSKIYLIHQTAREFLIRKESANHAYSAYSCRPEDIENQMAEICLRYLWMEDLEENEAHECSDPQSFLDYSAIYWPDHVRNTISAPDPERNNLLHQLYNTSTQRFLLWFPLFWSTISPRQDAPTMDGIHLAAFNGHEQVVRQLLAKHNDSINIPDSTGSYPVTWASLRGYDKVVRVLLEGGADVNAQSQEHGNALYVACSQGHDKIVQMLLERGADVNAQGGLFNSALYIACSQGHDKIVQMLLECGADVNTQSREHGNALHVACSQGHDKIVQMLLERGADVNAQGGPFNSALYVACSQGYDKIVQMLLECGADVNAQSREHGNALHVACSQGHDKIVQMLLERGADVNAQGGPFNNALCVACFGRHDKIVQMLLESGADVNAQGGRSKSALYVACSRGNDKIVRALLERRADVNAQGGEYSNALYVSCSRGHDKIVRVLLERGAHVDVQSGYFINALQVACSRGHDKIVQALLEWGADFDTRGEYFIDALQLACSRGHDKIVHMLQRAHLIAQSSSHDYPSKRFKTS